MGRRPIPFFSTLGQSAAGKLRWNSIKGKIFVGFAFTFLSIGVLAVLNFYNLSVIKARLYLGESYDDLVDDILELRRFEKNFQIDGDEKNLVISRVYLGRIDKIFHLLSDDLSVLEGEEQVIVFRQSLQNYKKLVSLLEKGRRDVMDRLRDEGKALTEDAVRFRELKRKHIHVAIVRTLVLPFVFMVILLSVMILGFRMVSNGLLKPLDIVRRTTELVGHGDFSPIRYKGESLEEISGLIDAFNRMARELKEHQEDLLQARKLAAIGTFTAGIAHELNNPINNIALTAESFHEEFAETLDDYGMELLQDIIEQTERVADIVRNLLDFSHAGKSVFKELSPEEIIHSTVNLIKNQVKLSGIDLKISVPANLPMVKGSLRKLQQVFFNLLMNAVQATSKGGEVRLSVNFSTMSGFLAFVVEDNGEGIAKEVQHKLFEPFYTTKVTGEGTGLGLAVCYSIVKQHGGRVEVESEQGQGARFTVLLPTIPKDFVNWSAA